MNSTKTPVVLVLKIAAIAVFVDLDGYEVAPFMEVWRDVKFGCIERTLTVTDHLSVYPNMESRHHPIETEECLTALPIVGQSEPTAVLTRR